VAAARERLIMVRTRLDDASSSKDIGLLSAVLPDLDEILTSLGVAKDVLQKQQAAFGGGYDNYSQDRDSSWYHLTPAPTPNTRKR